MRIVSMILCMDSDSTYLSLSEVQLLFLSLKAPYALREQGVRSVPSGYDKSSVTGYRKTGIGRQ